MTETVVVLAPPPPHPATHAPVATAKLRNANFNADFVCTLSPKFSRRRRRFALRPHPGSPECGLFLDTRDAQQRALPTPKPMV
jgi:hypothetical protein